MHIQNIQKQMDADNYPKAVTMIMKTKKSAKSELKAQRRGVKHFMTRCDWMSLEEKFYDEKDALVYYVGRLLIQEDKMNQALSIIQRHRLYDHLNLDAMTQVVPYFTIPQTKSFVYLENELFTKDAYAPTEELLAREPLGTYWNFRDFGIDPNVDLVWIEKSGTKAFTDAVHDLLSSRLIGFDSEFKFSMDRMASTGTDVLQLSTDKKVYLFDSMSLAECDEYQQFVRDLLSSRDIIKVSTLYM